MKAIFRGLLCMLSAAASYAASKREKRCVLRVLWGCDSVQQKEVESSKRLENVSIDLTTFRISRTRGPC